MRLFQDLRPQDSIPFLRRVSQDYDNRAVRSLLSMDDDPTKLKTRVHDKTSGVAIDEPPDIRIPHPTPARPTSQEDNGLMVKEHSFIGTTFSKRKWFYMSRTMYLRS